jgi:hypothetical protein
MDPRDHEVHRELCRYDWPCLQTAGHCHLEIYIQPIAILATPIVTSAEFPIFFFSHFYRITAACWPPQARTATSEAGGSCSSSSRPAEAAVSWFEATAQTNTWHNQSACCWQRCCCCFCRSRRLTAARFFHSRH